MKVQEHIIFFISLFLHIKGEDIIHISVQEGGRFEFHPTEVLHKSNKSTVEWKQTDKNKLLASFNFGSDPLIFDPRVSFTSNGSVIMEPINPGDTGNYTYKIIFLNGAIQTHNICLTVNTGQTSLPGNTEDEHFSLPGNTEDEHFSLPGNTEDEHFSLPVSQASNAIWMVLWVSLATVGAVLLSVAIIIVFKFRKKRSTDEPIYINTLHRRKEDPWKQNISLE